MPAWLTILQAVLPMIKTIIDMIKSNPPDMTASQEIKDAHCDIVDTLGGLHKSTKAFCEKHG